MALGIKSWFKKTFEPFFDPAGKDTAQRHADESVKLAEKNLPQYIKDMSPSQLATEINRLNQPNKWAITRMAAQGMAKQNKVGGNTYPPNYTSEKRRRRRLEQIKKGLITVNEVVNEGMAHEGNSQVVQ